MIYIIFLEQNPVYLATPRPCDVVCHREINHGSLPPLWWRGRRPCRECVWKYESSFFPQTSTKKTATTKRPRSVIGWDKKRAADSHTVHGEKKGEKRDFLARDFQGDFLLRPTSLNAFLSCRMFQNYCWIKRRCFLWNISDLSSCFCVPFPPPFFPWHSLRLLFKRG